MPTTMGDPAVTQKDTTFTKIFVGGLPYHTTDKSLREHFETYGDIEEAVVITDRQTGKSRGYGFVTMADRQAAERACKDANPIIDGRKANVNLAYIGAKPRGNAQHGADPEGFAGVHGNPSDFFDTGFPLPVRPGYPTLLPSQYGLPPQYVYPSPYIASPGLVSLPHTPISPAAAAAAAAAGQFYDYPAAYPGQYPNGFDTYPYPSASAAQGFVAPGYTYTLPQPVPAGAPGPFPLPYTSQPQIQEARMQ